MLQFISYVFENLMVKGLAFFYGFISAPAWEEHIGPHILFAQCPTYTKKSSKVLSVLMYFPQKLCVPYICTFFVACSSAPVVYSSLILLLFNEEYKPYFTYNVIFLACL